jgi:hypothetical protein
MGHDRGSHWRCEAAFALHAYRLALNLLSMPTIVAESVVVASRDQVASDLAGETVLLSMKTARYYGLADVGARIWELVREPVSVSTICATIEREYDVEPVRCKADVVRFLEDLAEHGLIEVTGGS